MVLGQTDIELEIEHLNRYYFAEQFVSGKNVLDAACGTGYGSAILAKSAQSVVGIDISEEAVSYATDLYSDSNVSFMEASVNTLPFDDNSFDTIVSFETIEHLDEKDQNRFLKEIKRTMKDDGILVISSPNHSVYKKRGENHFHVKELDYNEFKILLESKFKFVEFYSQQFEVCNTILDCKSSISNVNEGSPYEKAEYLISVCSNKELPSIQTRIIMRNDNKLESILNWAIENHNLNEAKNKHITLLDEEIENKDNELKNKNIELKNKDIELRNKDNELKNKDNELRNKDNELKNKNARIMQLLESERKLNLELKNKIAHINLLKENESNLNRSLSQLKKEKNELDVLVRNKIGHINQLLDVEREFERIKQSRAWKLMNMLWKLNSKLFPQGSKRRLVAKITWKIIKNPITFLRKLNSERIRNFFYYLKREGVSGVSRRFDDCLRGAGGAPQIIKINKIDENRETVKTAADYIKIKIPQFEKIDVSIVIPVYNQFEYTYHCIKSITENSDDTAYEILVGDDCSNDVTVDIKEIIEGLTVIRNKENLKFLKNCNHAAKFAKGEYILFLNNDTQVQKNWLKPLVDLIESKDDIGMVGSKLIYPDGRLQEAGGIVWKDGSAWNYGHLSDPADPEFNYVKEVDYISGAAIMIKRALWMKIGGFDERFAPAYYEDTDLAFEIRKHGYKVMYQPLSSVVHFEGISNGTDISVGQKAYQVVNREKFIEKWKVVLEKEHFENGEKVFLAKDRSRTKKHILVIDHYVPHYDKDAGSKCVYMYIKMFVKLGLKVTFIGDNFFKHEPYTTELNQMGVEVLYGNYYNKNWKEWLEIVGDCFDYAYLCRAHITIKYIDLVKKNTNAKIFYFNCDMQHLREYREYEITGDKIHLEAAKKAEEIEFNISKKADVLHVVGSYEQEILKETFPDKPVRNIPVFIYDKINYDVPKPSERNDILFVGGFTHRPNVDGVFWFNSEIFPLILQKNPSAIWHIVGSNVPDSIKELSSDQIIVHGFVPDDELLSLYRNCRICVAPLRFGAGVKGKIVEAAYNRIPLVTTPIGAEGLSVKEKAFIVAEKAEEFAESVIKLYENEDYCEELQKNCIDFIKNHFTEESAQKELLKDLN